MWIIWLARRLGVGGLLAVAALHANWARGSAWPAHDERALARAVIGRDTMPSARACLTVAALLATGAALVAGRPRRWPRVRRLGVTTVATTLAARGLIGAAGLMPQERRPATFARWNRRLYFPLCLALAALCAAGIAPLRLASGDQGFAVATTRTLWSALPSVSAMGSTCATWSSSFRSYGSIAP